MAMVGICGEVTNILRKRSELSELVNLLQNDTFRPGTNVEPVVKKIQ